MQVEKTKRIEWVDLGKGFSIFLVVIGHTGIPFLLSTWLGSFRMPFFFFVSGMCFKYLKYPRLNDLVKKRTQTLIQPYIIFSGIVFIWAYILNYELLQVKLSELYNGWNGIALWFIPVLLGTELVFYWLKKYLKKDYLLLLFLLLFSVISYVFYLRSIHFPFKLEVVFSSVLFYGVGNLSSKYLILFFERVSLRRLFYLLPIVLVLSIYLSINNLPRLDMAANIIGSYVPTYITAFVGVLMMFVISVLVSKLEWFAFAKKWVLFFGKNTYVILAFHQVVLMNLKMIFAQFNIPTYLNSGARHILLWGIIISFIFFINNYTPWVLGKKTIK